MRMMKFTAVIFLISLLPVSSQASILLDRVVAVVNQEVITWSELYKSMESDASPQLREMKDEERRKVFKENEATYLETLINLKLQLQEAKTLGIGASDDELKEGIENIKKKYGMTDSAFLNSLKKEGFTFDEYKRRLREQIVISKVVNQEIRSKIVVSEGDIEKYLEENKELNDAGEAYRLSQILFKKPKEDRERTEVEEKAAVVLGKLKAGEPFAELARQYSEDPTAAAGGNLGLIKKNQMMKEFVSALASMKPGEVSEPFWTERGLHIIKLDEVVAPKDRNEIKEEARAAVVNQVFAERYNAWIKALREKAYIEIRL
jgi:peptidyl-prolyl cis-trans isomerase SurA